MITLPRRFQPSTTIAALVAVVALVLVVAPAAKADRARRSTVSIQRLDREGNNAAFLHLGTPLYNAMQATYLAIERAKAVAPVIAGRPVQQPAQATIAVAPRTNVRDADSSRRDNRIVTARATSDVVTVRIELADETSVDVGVYNMLGKKVLDVFRGTAPKGISDYTSPVGDMPEGVYICILQGSDFRRAEKFYLSR